MVVNFDYDITVVNVVAANRFLNQAMEMPVYRKHRSRWAVALKNTGKTFYHPGEEQILSDSLHPVLLPRGSDYSWICAEEGECLLIEFDALQTYDRLVSFQVSDSSFFRNAFLKIEKCLRLATPEAGLEARYLLSGLLLQLLRSAEKEYTSKEKQNRLSPAIRYLQEHYYDPAITNDHLAGLCGISTVYFRKSFEAVYGTSPIRYLNRLRTQKAKDLLSSDYGSIAQVAQSVGYASVYHFSKMFKTYTGLSPTQYVKALRK